MRLPFVRAWGAVVLVIFIAHALGTTQELLGLTTPAALTAVYRLALSGLNLSFTLAFTMVGYATVAYVRAAPPTRVRSAVGTLWGTAVRGLGPLYGAVLLIGFGLEPLLAAARHLPHAEPARLTYYALGLANFDKLRIQPTSWPLAELWAVAVVGQWLAVGGALLALLPRRAWAAGLGVVLAASLVFQVRHAPETLLLKLHSASVFADFAVGGLAALWAPRLMGKSYNRLIGYPALAGVMGLSLLQGASLIRPGLAPIYRLTATLLSAGLLLAPWPALPSTAGAALRWLGRRAYATYCLHTVALGLAAAAIELLPVGVRLATAWLTLPLGLGMTVALAVVGNRLVRW